MYSDDATFFEKVAVYSDDATFFQKVIWLMNVNMILETLCIVVGMGVFCGMG